MKLMESNQAVRFTLERCYDEQLADAGGQLPCGDDSACFLNCLRGRLCTTFCETFACRCQCVARARDERSVGESCSAERAAGCTC